MRRTPVLLTAALLVPWTGGARHPTPTVVLRKQADVIRETLPEAREFFVRDVTIGRDDLARIRRSIEFTPEDPDLKFYLGKGDGGRVEGVVFFPQVNTVHGPLEVGLTMTPDGAIARAVVTKATVETKPWVLEATATGLLRRFEGMRSGTEVAGALESLKGKLGAMPYFEAQVIATAVHHGLVLYGVLYSKGG
jgi:hypothetical protein